MRGAMRNQMPKHWRQKDVKDAKDEEAKTAEKRKNDVVDRLGIRRRINHYLPESRGSDSTGWITVVEATEEEAVPDEVIENGGQ